MVANAHIPEKQIRIKTQYKCINWVKRRPIFIKCVYQSRAPVQIQSSQMARVVGI
jgi:hypothetical protein